MPQILVNYKKRKDNSIIVIKDSVVYADMPIAQMDLYEEIENPYIYETGFTFPRVIDKTEFFKNNKEFYIKLGEPDEYGQKIIEDEDKKSKPLFLPIDTKLEELRFVNGQVLKIDFKEEINEKGAE